MSFRTFGSFGVDGVVIAASSHESATIYVTKRFYISNKIREESFGMSPAQARQVAALLIAASDWCDQQEDQGA
jgi:hypothetical protein